MYTIKKLTKVRPLKSSVMSSTLPVAPKLYIETDFFIFARLSTSHTNSFNIYRERINLYFFALHILLEQTALHVAKEQN